MQSIHQTLQDSKLVNCNDLMVEANFLDAALLGGLSIYIWLDKQ